MTKVEVDVLGKSALISSVRPLSRRDIAGALAGHPEYALFSFRPVPGEMSYSPSAALGQPGAP